LQGLLSFEPSKCMQQAMSELKVDVNFQTVFELGNQVYSYCVQGDMANDELGTFIIDAMI